MHARQLGRAPAHVDADRDHGEHARHAERGRGQVGEVTGEQGNRHLDRRVVDPPPDGGDQKADHQPDRDSAGRSPDKAPTGLPDREAAGEDGHDRYAVEDERSPIVDQAFALDDCHDPSRHSEPLGDRGRG